MEDTKKWYTSRTVWGGIIGVVSSLYLLTGQTIAPEIQFAAAEILAQIGTAVGAALALYGRVNAEKKIG